MPKRKLEAMEVKQPIGNPTPARPLLKMLETCFSGDVTVPARNRVAMNCAPQSVLELL